MWDVVGGSSPRAGFTRGWHSAGRSLRDHPRSRGVYSRRKCGCVDQGGSSPLARGLHFMNNSANISLGIIPARAGFTYYRNPGTFLLQDHPRSRGVYSTTLLKACTIEGSSPLARGLPGSRSRRCSRRWIIPARAGFTQLIGCPQMAHGDHPRSRGVYGMAFLRAPFVRGSSPLARGLHAFDRRHRSRFRIIPARAGFTCESLVLMWVRPDHPRSRGVYSAPTCDTGSDWGSSPLARGLPTAFRESEPGSGIIPARAGFTTHPTVR